MPAAGAVRLAAVSTAPLRKIFREHVEFFEIATTPLLFISPSRFPETVVRSGTDIDWRQTPVILAERGLSRHRADRWFSDKGIQPSVYSQVAGNEAIIAMVAMGCGVGVVPRLVLERSPFQDQVEILETTPHLEPFRVGACTLARNRRNPAVRSFWQVLDTELTAREGRPSGLASSDPF